PCCALSRPRCVYRRKPGGRCASGAQRRADDIGQRGFRRADLPRFTGRNRSRWTRHTGCSRWLRFGSFNEASRLRRGISEGNFEGRVQPESQPARSKSRVRSAETGKGTAENCQAGSTTADVTRTVAYGGFQRDRKATENSSAGWRANHLQILGR